MKPSSGKGRKKHIKLFVFYILLCSVILFCLSRYHDPVRKFEALKLPPDVTVFLDTKGEYSDVCWDHYTVEKVIRCEKGLSYVRRYMLENNDPSDLEAVWVMPFDTLSDMDIYIYDSLDDETQNEIWKDGIAKYIKIMYWYMGHKGGQWELIKK